MPRGGARLSEKLRAHGGSVVSQFCRDLPFVLDAWLDATRPNAEAIFVGVPGPAPRAKLRRFYDLCGVGPSAAVPIGSVPVAAMIPMEPTAVMEYSKQSWTNSASQ